MFTVDGCREMTKFGTRWLVRVLAWSAAPLLLLAATIMTSWAAEPVSARDVALGLDLHADQRLTTRFLVEAGQDAVQNGPQGEQHLSMRAPEVCAREGGVLVAQQ